MNSPLLPPYGVSPGLARPITADPWLPSAVMLLVIFEPEEPKKTPWAGVRGELAVPLGTPELRRGSRTGLGGSRPG